MGGTNASRAHTRASRVRHHPTEWNQTRIVDVPVGRVREGCRRKRIPGGRSSAEHASHGSNSMSRVAPRAESLDLLCRQEAPGARVRPSRVSGGSPSRCHLTSKMELPKARYLRLRSSFAGR